MLEGVPPTVGLVHLLRTLTQIFPLQSFPFSLLGIDEGILGNHLNKQFLWVKTRSEHGQLAY
jgi:hypothetical protein